MTKSIFISTFFHIFMIILTALSLPFMRRAPLDLPAIVSVELIQIGDKTNLPFAPKAKKITSPISDIVDSYFIAKCGDEGLI